MLKLFGKAASAGTPNANRHSEFQASRLTTEIVLPAKELHRHLTETLERDKQQLQDKIEALAQELDALKAQVRRCSCP